MGILTIRGLFAERTYAARRTPPKWVFGGVFLGGLVVAGIGAVYEGTLAKNPALLVPFTALSVALSLALLGLCIAALIRFDGPAPDNSASSSTVVDLRYYGLFGCALVVLAATLQPFLGV